MASFQRMGGYLKHTGHTSFGDFLELLAFRVRCRLKSEASTSYLNYAWWLLEPVLYMATFYLVFGTLLNGGTANFVAYLLTGLIPWLWFDKSVTNSTRSILGGSPIIMQTQVPIALFPAEVVVQDSVKQLPVFLLLAGFLVLYGIEADHHWLALLPIALIQLALNLAAAFLVAAIVPFLPDVRFLVATGMMLLMFVSGIFYSYDLILPEHQQLFFMNPMAALIKAYRDVLLNHQWPDWWALGFILLAALVVLMLLAFFFKSNSAIYARVILET